MTSSHWLRDFKYKRLQHSFNVNYQTSVFCVECVDLYFTCFV